MTYIMTIEQYKRWKNSGVEIGKRKISACRAADALIKDESIKAFERHVRMAIKDRDLRMFVVNMVRFHFGSAEVDDLLTKLKVYPDWI